MTDAISHAYAESTRLAAEKARDHLRLVKLGEGCRVKRVRDGKSYHVTRVEFSAPRTWDGQITGGYVALYGRQFRYNGMLGDHVHSIGFISDVEALS